MRRRRRRKREIITLYNDLENLGRSGLNEIEADIIVWYAKRDPYNMLIGVLIASSLTTHRLLMPPYPLLSDSPITPQRLYITKRIKVILDFPAIFSMDEVDVEVYIFPPFLHDKKQQQQKKKKQHQQKRPYRISHSTKEEGLKNNRATNI